MDLDFHHEEQENGGSTWPETHTIHGVDPETGDRVGFLKYRTPRRAKDKIKIDRLEVNPEHKGNGYAGQMMDHLQERHPRTPIDHGDRTDEGAAWWASYTRGKSVSRGRTMGSLDFRQAAARPLYHGTSRDLDYVVPADQHGQGEVSTGLTRTDRAYATHDPQMARSYAEMSAVDTGGRPRVYQVEHSGPAHALEPDPGYDADVRSPHGFRVLREVPEHELTRLPRYAVHSISDLMEEHGGYTAGKGKPRRNAPDVARRADQAQEDGPGAVDSDSGRNTDGGEAQPPLRALAEHPKVESDLRKLPRQIQSAYHARVDDLRRGVPHSSTHALNGPLKGWQSTNLNFQYRVVHRNVGGELHVLSAGNHDESYDQGIRRAGTTDKWPPYLTEREDEYGDKVPVNISRANPRGPVGTEDEARQAGWVGPYFHGTSKRRARDIRRGGFRQPRLHNWQMSSPGDVEEVDSGHTHRTFFADTHQDALDFARAHHGDDADVVMAYLHPHHIETDSGGGFMPSTQVRDVAKAMAIRPSKTARYTPPRARLFGPTYGLDSRLWDGETLRPEIREDIIARFDAFCQDRGLAGWRNWTKIVFFGSEASEWTSKSLEGNGDFDLSIGIEYDRFRAANPKFKLFADADIADGLTRMMHAALNADDEWFAVDFGTWHPSSNSMSNGPSISASPAGAPAATSSWRSTMTTPVVRDGAAAASAFGASSALGVIRRSATSASIILGPHSAISPDGPPSIPLPEGCRWIGPFSHTWFANLRGWDIREIRPYAAYDVVAGEWIVAPPHLPEWSMKGFPEGQGLVEEVRGVIEMAEGILAMPEPYRTQNGAALWNFVHSNRSDAFGPQGEGWWDARNVIEKALDQKGLMQKLYECHVRAADPANLASPADWSNTPALTR